MQAAYAVVATGDEQRVRGWVRGHGSWGGVGLLGLMFLQAVVAVALGGALAWGE